MLIENLNNCRFVLIKDNNDINIVPLLMETIKSVSKEVNIATLCYNQPLQFYRNKLSQNIKCYNDNPTNLYKVERPTAVIIDSFNQMALHIGARQSLNCIRNCLCNAMITKLIIVIHADCEFPPKLETQLEYFSHLTLSPDKNQDMKRLLRIHTRQKKGAKIINNTEDLSNSKEGFKVSKVLSEKEDQDDSKILPHSLATFKIGLESKEILARDALQLPYLNKQNPGQVHYEHDAADDWDDEDPDEDLDI